MMAVKNILMPTDFSATAERALSHAAFLADQWGAVLHVLHVADSPGPEHRQAATAAGTVVEAVVQAPSVAGAVLDYAGAQDIDLIVMGTHGRKGFERILPGSVAEQIVRHAACPVFTLRADDAHVSAPSIRRILVPIDFSGHARVALDDAQALAGVYGARLDLLHVVPAGPGIDAPVALPDVIARARSGLSALMNGAAAPFTVQVQVGYPAAAILDFARDWDSDLIVIATHGRTGLARLLMGSVAEKVVRTAPCPVFTVKSFGRKNLEPDRPHNRQEAGRAGTPASFSVEEQRYVAN